MDSGLLDDQIAENGDDTLLDTSLDAVSTYVDGYGNTLPKPNSVAAKFNESLISTVSSFPCLFNADDKSFKDSKTKAKAWLVVGQKVNCAAIECKRRWRNLRNVYCRSRKKIEAGEASYSCWYYYDMIHSFLHDKVKFTVDSNYELLQDQEAGPSSSQGSGNEAAHNADPKPVSKARLLKRSATGVFRLRRPYKRRNLEPGAGATPLLRPAPTPHLGHGALVETGPPDLENWLTMRPVEPPKEVNQAIGSTPQVQQRPQTSSDLWAQSIGLRLQTLTRYEQAKFRVKVETLLMEAEMASNEMPNLGLPVTEQATPVSVNGDEEMDCKASIQKIHVP